DTLRSNCKEFGETPDNELKRLLVHGVLHLKGMDHSDNSPEQEMLVFQEDFLKKLDYKQIIKD
ncbi:MAG: rRNA maturation RNase YbeY, partial [Spirochaetaceae bacterium]|nr:rRNA maturation RNase YbeY [Spirochaetaceae bacterium]